MQLFLMLQAAFLDCLYFDLCPFSDDGFVTAEVDIGGRDVVKALFVTLVVVILNESSDLPFKIARQVIVLQQNAIFHGLMPASHCPAVATCSDERGFCLGFVDGRVRREHASCVCLSTIQPNHRIYNMNRYRLAGAVCGAPLLDRRRMPPAPFLKHQSHSQPMVLK